MQGYFVDTNVWIAFYFRGHPHHSIASDFIRRRSADDPATLARAVEHSFLRLELAAIPSASPEVWMDAYLAALAIRAGLAFATPDADFRRFEASGLDLHLLTLAP